MSDYKELVEQIKADFPEFVDDDAIIADIEEQLAINGGNTVEFSAFRNGNRKVKVYFI